MRKSRQPQPQHHPSFSSMPYVMATQVPSRGKQPKPVGRLRHRRSLSPLATRVVVALTIATTASVIVGSTTVAALNPSPVAKHTATLRPPTVAAPHSAPAAAAGPQRVVPGTGSGTVVHRQPGAVVPVPTKPVAGLKAPVVGLVDRHHAPTTAYAGAVRSFVVDTTWASVQPVQGGPIVHPNAIDNAIKLAQSNGMALKLRVAAGIYAPAWAKTLDGPPMTLYYTAATVSSAGTVAGTVGHFWTPKFAAAYADLQTKLAAAYDDVPQVRETSVTQCGTIFNETYLRNTKDPRNAASLLAGGFTRAQDEVCHNDQIKAHAVWQRTLSEVAFNPYQSIQPDGSTKQDMAYTLSQMDYCRQVLGANCMLANFSLSSSRIADSQYGVMYRHMQSLGGPLNFQTATAAKIGSYTTVLAFAATVGASSVELPTGYTSWPVTTLTSYATKMKG